jgi:selT/selW/selH-like putative selenoprotein
LAAIIQDRVGVEPKLVVGAKGAFEVIADGKLLFSKLKLDRFPEPEEVLSQLSRP